MMWSASASVCTWARQNSVASSRNGAISAILLFTFTYYFVYILYFANIYIFPVTCNSKSPLGEISVNFTTIFVNFTTNCKFYHSNCKFYHSLSRTVQSFAPCVNPLHYALTHALLEGETEGFVAAVATLVGQLLDSEVAPSSHCLIVETDEI